MKTGPKTIALWLLRAYKWALSPMMLPACRYTPTCSEYAMEAIDRFGLFRGGAMALARLLRCHPFVKGGYDPVAREHKHAAFDSGCGGQVRHSNNFVRLNER